MSEKTVDQVEHLYWIDFVRTVGAFFVVLVHASFFILYLWGEVPESHWMAGNVYDSIARVGVPLFLMISGALLLRKEENIFFFLKKRLIKIILPFVFWSIFYLWWRQNYPVGAKFSSIAISMFVSVLKVPASDHLWFLYALVVLYFFVPPLRLMLSRAKERDIIYILLLWLSMGPLVQLLQKLFSFALTSHFHFISGYWGYLLLGYWLSIKKIPIKNTIFFFVAGSLCTLATIWLTYIFSLTNAHLDGFFYDYLSLNVVFASGFFFISLKSIGEKLYKEKFWGKFFFAHGGASFGIYLIHPVILDILQRGKLGFRLSFRVGNPWYTISLAALLAYAFSFVIVVGMRKIPVLKKLVP
ncbi:MAG: acyltransferase family protein [Anaerolineae bacterium]|nr:acyltransferase family protein [Anaerolineae bacterium]MBT7189565.1 acyltransferase family protein [Anaerolineae bacterium]MBT7992098.1 acyltransferase family protein [Anaerolineae bacterium]